MKYKKNIKIGAIKDAASKRLSQASQPMSGMCSSWGTVKDIKAKGGKISSISKAGHTGTGAGEEVLQQRGDVKANYSSCVLKTLLCSTSLPNLTKP